MNKDIKQALETRSKAKIVAAADDNTKVLSSAESMRNTATNVLYREIDRLDKISVSRALSWDETKKLKALNEQLNATQREQREDEKFRNPDNLTWSQQVELIKENAKNVFDNMTPKEKETFIEWLQS